MNIKEHAKDITFELYEWLDDKVSAEVEYIEDLTIDEFGVGLSEDGWFDIYQELYYQVLEDIQIKYHKTGGRRE